MHNAVLITNITMTLLSCCIYVLICKNVTITNRYVAIYRLSRASLSFPTREIHTKKYDYVSSPRQSHVGHIFCTVVLKTSPQLSETAKVQLIANIKGYQVVVVVK